MVDLKITQHNLLQDLESVVKSIRSLELPTSFETKKITTSEIKDEENVRKLAATLPATGSHIYYFKVDKPEILSQYAIHERNKEFKYARINNPGDGAYVYVGSCTKTKLGNRFIQHCGWRDKGTYSLQLSKWIGDDELTFTFAYVEIKNGKEDLDRIVTQYIEDQLHKDLKPMFGKSGGNNKIKILK